jgi:hypothetical protein
MKKAPTKTTKASPATAVKAKPAKAPAVIDKPAAPKKAPAKAVKKPTVAAVKAPSAPTVKPQAAKAPAAKAPAAKAAAVNPPAQKPPATLITALVDIGYGNTLFVRGDGAGLSWDGGVALASVAENKWEIALPAASSSVAYKLLINDVTWSLGEDFQVQAGSNVTVSPSF